MSTLGYTRKQADRLLHKVDVEVARAEDVIARLNAIVPDSQPIEGVVLDDLRFRVAQLKDTIRRRTRK